MKMLISSQDLHILARIFISCRPVMGKSLVANERYLIKLAKQNQEIDFKALITNLPFPSPTYQDILDYAQGINSTSIDIKTIYGFFGGEPHFDKILGQLSEFNFKEEFAKKIFFAHILIPARITLVGSDSYKGEYVNNKRRVELKGLVSLAGDEKISTGQIVIVHYASIISTKLDKALENRLIQSQGNNQEFTNSCDFVAEIDYNTFWDLSRWTKKTLDERDI